MYPLINKIKNLESGAIVFNLAFNVNSLKWRT
jgi:hypothetical protein